MRLLLGLLIFAAWASISRYYYVCEIKNHCNNEPEEIPVELRPKTLSLILDDSITILKDYEQFAFKQDSTIPDLSDDNKIYLDSVAAYLNKDTLKNATITGFFRESERGLLSGIFEDLGVARAAGIRDLLVQRGVDESRISLDSRSSADEKLPEPLTFNLYQLDDEIPEEFAKIQFSFTNMTYSDANFEYNSDVFDPGDAFITYADSVKTYFELNPENSLTIIGHCDNKGTDKYNFKLGLRRAENTKKFFENLGINSDIIKTESKGEKEPVAPNDTDANRQKNRRVNFIIQ